MYRKIYKKLEIFLWRYCNETGKYWLYVPYFLTPWWFMYMLEPREYNDIPWLDVMKCRWNNHPPGPIYYSSGLEPDMHCKFCGDLIG